MKLKDPDKERRIMSVTSDIVNEKGLMGLSMSEVAKRVKISPSNLYIYFEHKEDLVRSVFFDTLKSLFEAVHEEMPVDMAYKKKVYHFFKRFLKVKIEHFDKFSYIEQFIHSTFFDPSMKEKIDDLTKKSRGLFLEGQKEMILKDDVEVELLIAIMHGTITSMVSFNKTEKIKLTEENIEKSFRMIWDAIRQ